MSFSEFTRIIGRGPSLSRPLTQGEAREAMGMVLDGDVEPLQLGGFLLVLRQRGETAAELAGFAEATHDRMTIPDDGICPDLDWPSYADNHRQQPWFILAALLLAENGFRVFMHGIAGEQEGAAPTRPVLQSLGITLCASLVDAANRLETENFAYVGLENFAPQTEALFHLKPVLGVRSVANTFARDLNPLMATTKILGIVHAAYRPLHQEALAILGQKKAAIFKGVGGEAQRNPYKTGQVAIVDGEVMGEQEWPTTMPGEPYLWRAESLAPDRVAALWRGELDHPAAVASIIATAAVALGAMGQVTTPSEAIAVAETMWQDHLGEPRLRRVSI